MMNFVLNKIKLYHFRNPLSSMVFGLNALVTKPSVSLAPMVTVAILSRYGYSGQEKIESNTSQSIGHSSENTISLDPATAMFNLTCFIPVIIGTLQLVLWSFYTIRTSHKTGYKISAESKS